MKTLTLIIALVATSSAFAQVASGSAKGLSQVYSMQNDSSQQVLLITGKSAKALYETAAAKPDDVDYYDGGASRVYRNELACTRTVKGAKESYSCEIQINDGKIVTAPRG